MSLVAGVGPGTFSLLFFIALLAVIAIFGYSTTIGKIIFWVMFLLLFCIFIGLIFSPRKADKKGQDDKVNYRWRLLPSFATISYLGVILAIVSYVLVVLLYSDMAVVIPT